ncbi:NUDIX hydrolase [Phytoactinopolyspora limicola]|uniref:NUDIX hydrolase n=1 Tax=Phytoactinopolyspora limicola TaxID=2715536 RepID=UPI0014079D48|nr:NUDIX domain-containing protein [Phytoactinopolyspora limicola]
MASEAIFDRNRNSTLTEVGALIVNDDGRVFVQRRSKSRGLFPGAWDIAGGAVEEGESAIDALSREIVEETGWTLAEVLHEFSAREWSGGSRTHVEADFIVRVAGDLDNPRLESEKHDDYRWIGPDDIGLLEVSAEHTSSDFILRLVSDSFSWLESNPW